MEHNHCERPHQVLDDRPLAVVYLLAPVVTHQVRTVVSEERLGRRLKHYRRRAARAAGPVWCRAFSSARRGRRTPPQRVRMSHTRLRTHYQHNLNQVWPIPVGVR
jgi:hypothetical protein